MKTIVMTFAVEDELETGEFVKLVRERVRKAMAGGGYAAEDARAVRTLQEFDLHFDFLGVMEDVDSHEVSAFDRKHMLGLGRSAMAV